MSSLSRTFGITEDVARGVNQLMRELGHAPIQEFTLPSGRRLDVAALTTDGCFVGVEVKVSVEDFRADRKWVEYLEYCDQYYFAVPDGFPLDLLPSDHGLIIADKFGAAIIRASQHMSISAARRKAMLIKFGRNAAERLIRGNGSVP